MNRRYLIGIGVMFIGVLFIIIRVIIPNDKTVITDEQLKEIENKEISCIEEKLNKYVNTSKEILLSDITDKNYKIKYFKGFSDGFNSYIMFIEYNGTYEYEVMKDFDLYFINKYDIYQKFTTNFGMTILIHTEDNNIDEKELISSCYVDLPIQYKTKNIPINVINDLRKTSKIKFEYGDKEINDKNIIEKLVNAVSNSSQIFYKGTGNAFLCDGPSKLFMYDEKGNLIDTLYVYGDGNRLIPESVKEGGCEYYTTKEDIRKIFEEGTDIIYHGITDYSEVCASALELIYEDDNYKYYFSCIKSDLVLINFTLNNKVMKLKYALDNNYIKPEQLIIYNNLIIKEDNKKIS